MKITRMVNLGCVTQVTVTIIFSDKDKKRKNMQGLLKVGWRKSLIHVKHVFDIYVVLHMCLTSMQILS